MKNKIVVVGGCGHIGLPLCIVLANAGFEVVAYDINTDVIKEVEKGNMPFIEEDGEVELRKALNSNKLHIKSELDDSDIGSDFILTLGTPVDEFLNPSLNIFEKSLTPLLKYFSNNSLIILRSTVFPGTTEWLHNFLEKNKKKANVAFCFERVVQCKTLEEIKKFPQIIASTTHEANLRAKEIFLKITSKVIFCEPKEAEFSKLFLNSFRYIQFAIANQFYMIADSAGLDFNKIRKIMSDGYPRADGLPGAGFAAGPCLFKDTMQLASFAQNNFSLGTSAMLVNEGIVLYIRDLIKKNYDYKSLNVGLLGMAFKAECDDIRSSLSYKIKKVLKPLVSEVLCTDNFVKNDESLVSLDETLEKSDLLILCTPHSYFKQLKFNKPIIDIWNYLNDK